MVTETESLERQRSQAVAERESDREWREMNRMFGVIEDEIQETEDAEYDERMADMRDEICGHLSHDQRHRLFGHWGSE